MAGGGMSGKCTMKPILPFSDLGSEIAEVQLQITGSQESPPFPPKDDATTITNQPPPPPPPTSMLKHWRWWLMVALNILFVLAGQTAGDLLGRFYYNEGGKSMWMATLVQSAGFPILLIPLLLLLQHHSPPSSSSSSSSTTTTTLPLAKMSLICIALGFMVTGDNLMYSYGLLYLPLSTYSLVCASQLAFNAVFSYFLNSQKFTHLIFNSVVLLTFSAALLGVRSESAHVTGENFSLGFILTLAASALFSFILSLIQLSFQKVLKTNNFGIVLMVQIAMSAVEAVFSVVGLFVSGEWRNLNEEMAGYRKGGVSYVMTLAWAAVAWQVAAVGIVGLTFVVSSLFSNVMSTVALPVVPIFAVVFFGDTMDGVKVVAMLIAVWGFLSYIYQQYLYDLDIKIKDKRDGLQGI